MSKHLLIMRRFAIITLISISFGILTGCASTSSPDNDPLEGLNRKITTFNLKADKYVIAPAARGYKKVLPQPVRNGVHNFLTNLREPYTVLNDLLQGQFRLAAQDTGRFVINSTLGFFGLNDVASYMEMPRRSEDFGQTLAVWGVPSGPHLVLPILGPSNLRDTAGLVPDIAYTAVTTPDTSPADTVTWGVRLVDGRAQFLGVEEVIELQPDAYLFLREGYRQRRQIQIQNNAPSEEDSDDALLEQLNDS